MINNFLSYMISDPKYYSNNLRQFEKKLREVLKSKKIDIACFRDKTSNNTKELAKIFIRVCKEFHIDKILLNENYKLAKKLGVFGVHLTSKQFNKIEKAKDSNLYTIISCHNCKDLQNASKAGVNAVTYSPIFETPNKGKAKGIEKLKKVTRTYEHLNIIALGGITSKEQIKLISKTKAYGFASIRYFA